jgi:hypothetical protein
MALTSTLRAIGSRFPGSFFDIYSYHPLPVVFEKALGAKCVMLVTPWRSNDAHIILLEYGTRRAKNTLTCCLPTREYLYSPV